MNDRDELADNIYGWAIGSGYYSQNIDIDEAREIADHLIRLGYAKTTASEWGVKYEHTSYVGLNERGGHAARALHESLKAEGIRTTVVTRKVTEWQEA